MCEASSFSRSSSAPSSGGGGVITVVTDAIGLVGDAMCVWRKKPTSSLCPPTTQDTQPPISGLTSWEWLLPSDFKIK